MAGDEELTTDEAAMVYDFAHSINLVSKNTEQYGTGPYAAGIAHAHVHALRQLAEHYKDYLPPNNRAEFMRLCGFED